MIEYLQNEEVKNMLDSAPIYQKSALTGLKKIKFTTYVKDGLGVRIESEPFLPGVVIARNPGVIGVDKDGVDIYNEWPIPIDIASKNYGAEVIDGLTDNITWHKKKATIKAVELTKDIMDLLKAEGDTLYIKVSWSPDPMVAKIGDYITNEGYSVSAIDMKKTYEEVKQKNENSSVEEVLNKFRNSDSNSLKKKMV